MFVWFVEGLVAANLVSFMVYEVISILKLQFHRQMRSRTGQMISTDAESQNDKMDYPFLKSLVIRALL